MHSITRYVKNKHRYFKSIHRVFILKISHHNPHMRLLYHSSYDLLYFGIKITLKSLFYGLHWPSDRILYFDALLFWRFARCSITCLFYLLAFRFDPE